MSASSPSSPSHHGPSRHRPQVTILTAPGLPEVSGMERIKELADVRVTDRASLIADLQGSQVLFLWDFFSSALKDAWSGATALDWVHVAAAGVDAMMFDALTQSPVTVTNSAGIFDEPIAEYVLAQILAHDKELYVNDALQREKTWRHRETQRTAGKNALVIGTGGIGRATARLLKAVGLNVQGVGRVARDTHPDFGVVHASSNLENIIGWADHVVAIAPLTPSTRGLLNARTLGAAKPGAHLVNVGRGELVIEEDLLGALNHGPLAAASLDVFATEPLPERSPLWSMDTVHISAHQSGDVVGWREALAQLFVQNLERYVTGQPLLNMVDKSAGYKR